jgi:hypothetical protein
MYFGKIKNTENEWGFDVFTNTFETYITISDAEHMRVISEANTNGKLISGDEDGNPILVDPPPPTEEEVTEQRIDELQSYLSSTDWYAIRQADEGTPIPPEIKTKRAEARIEISELRETLSSSHE